MFDRISVTIALNTILAVLAKLAFLLYPDPSHFLFADPQAHWKIATILLVVTFLIFFRGKMMHDDHLYFTDLEKGLYHDASRWLNKFALFLGYVSWILWAPAIFFLGEWDKFGGCMAASILVSTIWAAIDSKQIPRGSIRYSEEEKPWINQHYWILTNIIYITSFVVIACSGDKRPSTTFSCAILLLCVLIVDWLISKPIANIIEVPPKAESNCRFPPGIQQT